MDAPSCFSGASGKEVFTPRRKEAMGKSFSCSMSEALSLSPIMAHWVTTVLKTTGVCAKECDAFLVHADLITMLQAAVQGDDKVSAAEVRSCAKAFLQ